MLLSHLSNIFLYWHGLRIYFRSGYIFWSVGVSGVLVSAKNLGFFVFRVQIWKCTLFQMKNRNKIGEI
jgi:hypothetical protein